MNRGKADKNDKRGMEDFYRHDVNEIFDDSATRYLSKMKEIIKKVRSEDK